MKTITFYSYKGGVGRSLLVANAAKYLSTLGKSVLAIDLDLEAPGLHYKFELGMDAQQSEAAPGVVDILSEFLEKKTFPISLDKYLTDVKVGEDAGRIQIMRAGMAPLSEYWGKLSKISWHDILYGPEPVGAPFFLELKERIRRDIAPDFLLIDARTGITEMGGIATTLLPDTVVCLALASREHLEGLRAVVQGIYNTAGQNGSPVQLLAVISRLSQKRENDGELSTIRSFLSTPINANALQIALGEVFALHSEPLLDLEEQLLIGGANSPHEFPLLRDYLRLFSKIIPPEEVRPFVGKLIQQAISRVLDDPDGAQSALETLTTYCADDHAYKALLKLYMVRKVSPDKILATASLMWQMRDRNAPIDQILIEIIQNTYGEAGIADIQKKYAEFAGEVWKTTDKDARICLAIVNALVPLKRQQAVQLLTDYVEDVVRPDPIVIIRLIDILSKPEEVEKAFQLVDRFKSSILLPEFHVAWAKAIVRQKSPSSAKSMLDDPDFRPDAVRALDPSLMYRILKLVDDEGADDYLRNALEAAASAENFDRLRSLSEIFVEDGDSEELEMILAGRLPTRVVNDIVSTAQRHSRRELRLNLGKRKPWQ
jgi:CobQ/CobB/MinD/ParA nucleotide binding domain